MKEILRSFLRKVVIQFFRVFFLLKRNRRLRIGFLTDEFEHPDLMPFGGYGMTLKFVTDYLNNKEGGVRADVLMCDGRDIPVTKVQRYHSADLIFLPRERTGSVYFQCSRLLAKKGTNLFVGIDHYSIYEYYLKNFPYIPWVVWIKDPKDRQVWEKISTIPLEVKSWGVSSCEELIQKSEHEAASLKKMLKLSRDYNRKVYFAAEAKHLAEIASRLYGVKDLNAFHWPKPIPLPNISKASFSERPSFLFLARLDPIKRPWIYFELAKRFKDADFYVAGKSHYPELMNSILEQYKDVPNLKFMGRVVGDGKAALLERVWAVVNTSIHEGVPVSLLEGFSYGKPAVAALNPDGLTSRFGVYVGDVPGEGKNEETIEKFCQAIEQIINGKLDKHAVGWQARQYIADAHSFTSFESTLINVLGSSNN